MPLGPDPMVAALRATFSHDTTPTLDAIRDAFAGVRRGEVTLHEAIVIDGYGTDEARQSARERDRESRWEEVPAGDIEFASAALSFVDPASWRYYLPAFMSWSLENYRTGDKFTSDAVLYALDPDLGDGTVSERSLESYALLNDRQCAAVCRYLRYMAGDDGYADTEAAARALSTRWGRYWPDERIPVEELKLADGPRGLRLTARALIRWVKDVAGRWIDYDPTWLIEIARDRDARVARALSACTRARLASDSVIEFVDRAAEEYAGGRRESGSLVRLDHPEEGPVLLSVLRDGQISHATFGSEA